MEFGMKRVMASVQVVSTMKRLYTGTPITIATLSRETSLSASYLEQIFSKLRASNIVVGQRGPGGGYHLCENEAEISVAKVIRSVTSIPVKSGFEPVLIALDRVLVSDLHNEKISAP